MNHNKHIVNIFFCPVTSITSTSIRHTLFFLQQLDAEVEYIVKSWETLRGVQDGLEVKELKGRAVKEEDLSELLKLQERVKNKIHQSESILNLTSSFHITSKQVSGAGGQLKQLSNCLIK